MWFIAFLTSDGPKLRTIRGKDEFFGVSLTGNTIQFEASRQNILKEIIAKLEKRFEADEKILRACAIADLAQWPLCLKDNPGRLGIVQKKKLNG